MDTRRTALAELRRESQSIFNRIHSIAEDAAFVERVHEHYPHFPLLANMRCGAWYTDPEIASSECAYFKSTDGHTNNWSFNLRRPNLHILPLIAGHAGIILVDSTRAGKRIPDAQSKTVPIWCAVVNRAIVHRSHRARDTALYTPPGSVSLQEHSQIEHRLDDWASDLAASSYVLPVLDYPLRPIWITPATTVFPTFPSDHAFYPIVCVSASKQVTDGLERRASGFTYIQGSGDDHELWSMGLTPTLYWKHRNEILTTPHSDLPNLVRSLVSASAHTDSAPDSAPPSCGTPIQHISGRIAIATVASLRHPNLLLAHPDTAFVHLTPDPVPSPTDAPITETTLRIHAPEGKKGQHHFLTVVLPRAIPFIQHHLQHDRTVCIACTTGTDASVGVALTSLALFFRNDGSCCPRADAHDVCTCSSKSSIWSDRLTRSIVAKDVLKTRLHWIISSCPRANPSRTTLKRVNDFLLSPSSNLSMLDVPTPGPVMVECQNVIQDDTR